MTLIEWQVAAEGVAEQFFVLCIMCRQRSQQAASRRPWPPDAHRPGRDGVPGFAIEMSTNEFVQEPLPSTPVTLESFAAFGMRAQQSTEERYELLAGARRRGTLPAVSLCPTDGHRFLGPGDGRIHGAVDNEAGRAVEQIVEGLVSGPTAPTERYALEVGREPGALLAVLHTVLRLELCALSCHVLRLVEVSELAERLARECAVLAQGDEEERQAFIDDKRAWLKDELQLDDLLALRQDLVAELEQTRMQHLAITGQAVIDLVEAAHRVGLMRYRCALNDPTLTAEELGLRLQQETGSTDESFVLLEPELRQALLDTVQGVQSDHRSLRRLASLCSKGNVQPASDEDRRLAALLFRRLARLIHPDALGQHEDFAAIAPEHRQRLKEIWHQASATHGVRIHLSRDKLINYVEHLQAWIAEAERILRLVRSMRHRACWSVKRSRSCTPTSGARTPTLCTTCMRCATTSHSWSSIHSTPSTGA